MYAFRKPYTAGSYAAFDSPFADLDFKMALVISQILGYMLAKFIGIKVIAEMTANRRAMTIVGMIAGAQLALMLFAVTPTPFNIIWLFFNGLSLGMIWGLVFSFLEGRRTSELLGAVLATTFIIASGVVRTVGRWLLLEIDVPVLWMPAATGGIFFLPLLLSVFFLSQVPPPTVEDERLRQKRQPMNAAERWAFLRQFGPGIFLLVASFFLFTGLRDFRDNFSPELWTALGYGSEPTIFAYAGVRMAFFVLFALGAMVIIKNNRTAFFVNHGFILLGSSVMLGATYLFQSGELDGKIWMVALGAGLYTAYIPYNCFLFDRMISAVGVTANAGFLLYLADSAGYVGSVSIMLYRNFAAAEISWLSFFINSVYMVGLTGMLLVIGSAIYFQRKLKRQIGTC